MSEQLPRISIKCGVLGCVSAGKSTLVNAILVRKVSDAKIKRTTMLPQVYLEGPQSDDVTNILKQNTQINEDILTGKVELTEENCKNMYHKVSKLYDIIKLPSSIHLDIYDIPGLNDSNTESIYYNYIDTTFNIFDIIFVVVDITEAFNTSASIKILDNIIKNSINNKDKTVNVCIIANKCDDLDDNLEFIDEEYIEMYEQIHTEVGKRFDNIDNITYEILKMSAEDSFIYRMYNKNPNVELDPKLINKFGLNEFGRRKWTKMSAEKQKKKITEFLADGDMNDRLRMCGFTQFQSYLQETINYKRQYDIISNNIKMNIQEMPLYTEEYEENITDKYNKYGILAVKMYNLYGKKCKLEKKNNLYLFINNRLSENVDNMWKSFTLNINSIDLFDYYNKIKEKLMKTKDQLTEVYIDNNSIDKLNNQHNIIKDKQNEWIVKSFDSIETYKSFQSIIYNLIKLQENDYTEFEPLIENIINKTISTVTDLITNNTELIKYIKYIMTLGSSLDKCFEFIKTCYIFKISRYNCIYHTSLLDLQLNTLHYNIYNAEFTDYLHNLKVLNFQMFKQHQPIMCDPNNFATLTQKNNIMSLFKYMLQLYDEINNEYKDTEDIVAVNQDTIKEPSIDPNCEDTSSDSTSESSDDDE